MRQSRAAGFTLVELLICIGIIAVLVAISIPVIINLKNNARASACMANIRQSGKSIQMYANDYNDSYPIFHAWERWSKFHHNSLPSCPLIEDKDKKKVGIENFPEKEPHYLGVPGYAMNADIQMHQAKVYLTPGKPPEIRECRISDVSYPTTTVMLCEQSAERRVSLCPNPYEVEGNYPFGIVKDWERHSGGVNYFFCDGHAKWYRPEAVSCASYPLGPDGKNIGNDGVHPSFMKASTEDIVPFSD